VNLAGRIILMSGRLSLFLGKHARIRVRFRLIFASEKFFEFGLELFVRRGVYSNRFTFLLLNQQHLKPILTDGLFYCVIVVIIIIIAGEIPPAKKMPRRLLAKSPLDPSAAFRCSFVL
jgi:hypothetical protein